jgi:hypothetical protein
MIGPSSSASVTSMDFYLCFADAHVLGDLFAEAGARYLNRDLALSGGSAFRSAP